MHGCYTSLRSFCESSDLSFQAHGFGLLGCAAQIGKPPCQRQKIRSLGLVRGKVFCWVNIGKLYKKIFCHKKYSEKKIPLIGAIELNSGIFPIFLSIVTIP